MLDTGTLLHFPLLCQPRQERRPAPLVIATVRGVLADAVGAVAPSCVKLLDDTLAHAGADLVLIHFKDTDDLADVPVLPGLTRPYGVTVASPDLIDGPRTWVSDVVRARLASRPSSPVAVITDRAGIGAFNRYLVLTSIRRGLHAGHTAQVLRMLRLQGYSC